MKLLLKISQVMGKQLIWFVVGIVVLAMLLPASLTWSVKYVTISLQIIMFTMGLSLRASSFSGIVKNPLKLLLILLLQFLWMPFAAYLIARLLSLPADIALGLILVGSAPSGTSSNVFTMIAKGDLPLSVTAVTVATFLAPVLTPALLAFFGGEYLEINFWAMFISILKVVLIPVIAGVVINTLFSKYVKKYSPYFPIVTSLAIIIIIGGVVAINQARLLTSGVMLFIAILLHNLSGYGASYLVCKGLRLDKDTTRTVAIDVAVKNTGLSTTLALNNFTPPSSLAGAAGTVIHTIVGMVFANFIAKMKAKKG